MGVWVNHFLGRIFPVPRRGLRIICDPDENLLSMFSAMAFRCKSLVTSVYGREVGGSRFMVKVSSVVKFRGGWVEGEGNAGKTFSVDLQLANLALSKTHVVRVRYLMIEGELNPT